VRPAAKYDEEVSQILNCPTVMHAVVWGVFDPTPRWTPCSISYVSSPV
jgi:hypothetical protein